MPATCDPGEAFFDLNAVAGNNLYLCAATNTWSRVLGSGVAGPAGAAQFGVAVFSDTTGSVLAEGTGCKITTVLGKGVLTCDGGFEAGDGSYQGGLITKETAANGGTFEWAIFGPADQAGDRCIVFPDQQPAAGQVLTAAGTLTNVVLLGKTWTGCRMMTWQAPSGGGATDWIANPVLINEDFIVGDSITPGMGGWKVSGTKAWKVGEVNAPGIYQVATGSVLNNAAYMRARDSAIGPLVQGADFTMDCRVRFSVTTNVAMMCGLQVNSTDVSSSTTNHIYTQFNTATDTQFVYSSDAGATVTVASGVTPVANTWYRFHTVRVGTTLTFSIYDSTGALIVGSTKTICPVACDAIGTPPGSTSTVRVLLGIETLAAVAVRIDVDLFRLTQTGLSR